MSEHSLVIFDVFDKNAILTIKNPPVNALGQEVRKELLQAIDKAVADPSIQAIILIGAYDMFCGGADVREFEGPPLDPQFPELIDRIEQSTKPVIAAIAGVALGGGLEVAIGCHYRVADKKARMGLPEVTLGIMPGAGGTVRLPRLIGAEAAIDLGTTGRRIDAQEALSIGLVDTIADGDLLSAACTFAHECVARDPRRLINVDAPVSPGNTFFEDQSARLKKQFKGQTSPLVALETYRAGLALPLKEAMDLERNVFLNLRHTDQAKALRHVFFAERRVGSIPETKDIVPNATNLVAVIGGGTMGTGIASRLLLSGYEVTLVEIDRDGRKAAADRISSNLDGAVKRGKLDEATKDQLIDGLLITGDISCIGTSDLIIEAIFEDLNAKHKIFETLDPIMKPGATLATNTSYLNLDTLANATSRPADVLGLHFFSPAHIMRLLEIIRGKRTSDQTLARGFQLAKKMEMVGVSSGACEGYIGNRILEKMRQAAFGLIKNGLMPWEVDAAIESFGMAMGPFRVMDLAGLDIAWARSKSKSETRDPNDHYAKILDLICVQGWFGRKTDRGWYRYEKGKPRGIPDMEVEGILLNYAKDCNISRREYSATEIQDHIMLPMISEAARILDEGIAQRASDIDLVEIHGYGFPRWLGGPTHYADRIGLAEVVKRIEALSISNPGFCSLSPLLARLAENGSTFASFDEANFLHSRN